MLSLKSQNIFLSLSLIQILFLGLFLNCYILEGRLGEEKRKQKLGNGNYNRASHIMGPITPRIRTSHILPTPCSFSSIYLEFDFKALLLTHFFEPQTFWWYFHRHATGLHNGNEVPGLPSAHIGNRSMDGDGAIEIGDRYWWIVEIERGWWALGAWEGGVHLNTDAGAREEEVVSVGGLVDQTRVRGVGGSNMARSIFEGSCHCSGRIRYQASLGVFNRGCNKRSERKVSFLTIIKNKEE